MMTNEAAAQKATGTIISIRHRIQPKRKRKEEEKKIIKRSPAAGDTTDTQQKIRRAS